MSRRRYVLVLGMALGACRGESDEPRDPSSDSIAPIGTGTELLLTRERLELIDDWIRASIGRRAAVPTSLDDVRPPEDEASRYVPLGQFLRDGWGRAIEYEYDPASRTYQLRSLGEDGAPDTADDVTLRGTT
jgi:hypothetical protein